MIIAYSNKTQAGFTLTELLIVIAIMGILASAAVLNIAPVMERRAVNSAANMLAIALQDAGLAAIRRSNTTVVCPIIDQTCTSDPWNQDYGIITTDASASLGTTLVKRFERPQRDVKIITNETRFSFTSDGYVSNATPIVVRICHPKHSDYWIELILDTSGIVTQNNFFYTGTTICV